MCHLFITFATQYIVKIIVYLVTLQIRDWLTVEEEMLRQQSVVVGDVDEIMHLLDKQKVSPLSNIICQQIFFKLRIISLVSNYFFYLE